MSSLFAAAILAVVATVVAAMNIMNVTAADPVRWTGAVSTDWSDAQNWDGGVVPTEADIVVIDGGTNQPILNVSDGSVTIAGLAVGGGSATSTLTIAGGAPDTNELRISGDLSITSGGVITHAAHDGSQEHGLALRVMGDATIKDGGSIDVSGKGSAAPGGRGGDGGAGWGYRSSTSYPGSEGLDSTTEIGAQGGDGGTAYGETIGGLSRPGAGGAGGSSGCGNDGAAGSYNNYSGLPAFGGGGGGGGGCGGSAGGVISLIVEGDLDIQGGVMSADGDAGSSGGAGGNGLRQRGSSGSNFYSYGGDGGDGGDGGAGGSITVNAQHIYVDESTSIRARGGDGGSGGPGGTSTLVSGTPPLDTAYYGSAGSMGYGGAGGHITFTGTDELAIYSVLANMGSASGGDNVTITGANFTPNTIVTFNGVAADTSYVDSTTLNAVVPVSQRVGAVDVVVTDKTFADTLSVIGGTGNGDGGATGTIYPENVEQVAILEDGFTYLGGTPTVTNISPAYGKATGGETITITGTNFYDNPSVMFGEVSAASVAYVNSTTLTAVTPNHAAGAVDVSVVNSDGQTTATTQSFTFYDQPSITGIVPDNGYTTGGDTVTIVGSGFSAGSTVGFGEVLASIVSITPTAITVTTPTQSTGAVNVTVTDVIGQSATIEGGYTYNNPPPSIHAISPNRGPAVGGQQVTITGMNFSGTNLGTTENDWVNTNVSFNDFTYGSSVAVVNDKIYMFGGFSSNKILVADIANPESWSNTGKTLPATLYGSQLAIVGDKIYLFGGYNSSAIYSADVSDPTTWTNTGRTLPAATPYAQLAIVGDKIYIFGGQNAAGIYSADVSDPTTWTNTGKTLPTTLGYSQIAQLDNKLYLFGGITGSSSATNVIYSADTSDPTTWTNTGKTLPETLQLSQLAIVGTKLYLIGGAISGSGYHGKIFSADTSDPTTWTNTGKTLPVARGISQLAIIDSNMYLFGGYPSGASILRAPLTVSGANRYNKPWITNHATNAGGSLASLGGSPVAISSGSSTSLTGITSAHAPGVVDLTVTGNDGQSTTLPDAYEYVAAPEITSVSPNEGLISGGDSVIITGTNFSNSSIVKFGDETATITDLTSTTITVVTPANLAGAKDVTVTDEFGQTGTLEDGFTYVLPPPTISNISPNRGPSAGGQAVTISGDYFMLPQEVGDNVSLAANGATASASSNEASANNAFDEDPSTSWATGRMYVGSTSTLTSTFESQKAIKQVYYSCTKNNTGISSGRMRVTIELLMPDQQYYMIAQPNEVYGSGAINVSDTVTLDIPVAATAIRTTITWVSLSAVTAGGSCDTISAYEGTAGSVASLGGQPLATQIVSGSSVQGITAPYQAGVVDLVVTNADGQSTTLPDAYEYVAAPEITSVSPNNGAMTGGNTVTITGVGFENTDSLTVRVNGIETSNLMVINDTTLMATIPASTTAGPVDVTVEDEFGQTAEVTGGYTYVLPQHTMSNISPAASRLQGGTTVTITGTNFVERSSGVWYDVYFGDTKATEVTRVNNTTLQVIVPEAVVPGKVDIRVVADETARDSANQDAVLAEGFMYVADYVFTNEPLNLAATEPGMLTIEARDQNGEPIAGTHDIEIQLSSTSSSGFFARDLDEDESTRWDYSSVVIPAGQTSVSFYYRDSEQGTPTITARAYDVVTTTQQQTIGPRYIFEVTGVSDPIQAGVPSSVTVRVVDWQGQPLTGYTGTIRFSSDDLGAVLPSNYTMRPSDNGVKTFVNGVTMRTAGEFCVTATDTVNSSIRGSQCDITVTPAAEGTITQLAIVTPEQSFPSNGHSSPITIQTQGEDGAPISVTEDTTIYLYTNSETGQFSLNSDSGWTSNQPFAVTIPAGLTAASVYYRDTAVRTGTISARDNTGDTADNGEAGDFGWRNATQDIRSGVGAPTRIAVAGPTRLEVDQRGQYTIELQDENGNPVTAESDVHIRVDGDTDTSQFYFLPDNAPRAGPVEFVVPGGSSRATIQFSDSVPSAPGEFTTLTFVDGRPETESVRLQDATYQVRIGLGDPHTLVVQPIADQSVRKNTAVRVDLADEFGNITYDQSADITVSLVSDKDGVFGAQELIIPAGQSGATAQYRALETGDHTVTATSGALQQASATFEATPVRLALGGSNVAAIYEDTNYIVSFVDIHGNAVVLDEATPISLSASHETGSFDPSDVTVTAGQASTTAQYTDTELGTRVLKATSEADGVLPGELDIEVVPGPYNPQDPENGGTIAFRTESRTLIAGEPQLVQIEFRDKHGVATTLTEPVVLQLSTTSTRGSFSENEDPFTSTSTITIPAGSDKASFYYRDERTGQPTLTVRDRAHTPVFATQAQTVVAAAPASFEFVSSPQLIVAGSPSSAITVRLLDAYGNRAQVGDEPIEVSLDTSSDDGAFSLSSGADEWSAVTTLTMPSGAQAAEFYYRDSALGEHELTVSGESIQPSTQTIEVIRGYAAQVALTPAQDNAVAGDIIPVHLELQTSDGESTVAVDPVVIDLAARGQFSLSNDPFVPISNLTLSSRQGERTLYFHATDAGTINLVANPRTSTITSGNAEIEVQAGDMAGLQYATTRRTIQAGSVSEVIEVEIRDAYGNRTAAPEAFTIELSTRDRVRSLLIAITGKARQSYRLQLAMNRSRSTTQIRVVVHGRSVPRLMDLMRLSNHLS